MWGNCRPNFCGREGYSIVSPFVCIIYFEARLETFHHFFIKLFHKHLTASWDCKFQRVWHQQTQHWCLERLLTFQLWTFCCYRNIFCCYFIALFYYSQVLEVIQECITEFQDLRGRIAEVNYFHDAICNEFYSVDDLKLLGEALYDKQELWQLINASRNTIHEWKMTSFR